MVRINKTAKEKLEDQKLRYEDAIILTGTYLKYCVVPATMDLYISCLKGYRQKLMAVEAELEGL